MRLLPTSPPWHPPRKEPSDPPSGAERKDVAAVVSAPTTAGTLPGWADEPPVLDVSRWRAVATLGTQEDGFAAEILTVFLRDGRYRLRGMLSAIGGLDPEALAHHALAFHQSAQAVGATRLAWVLQAVADEAEAGALPAPEAVIGRLVVENNAAMRDLNDQLHALQEPEPSLASTAVDGGG